MRYCGFEPYVNEDSEVLILGSFPSVKSRAQNFYYGNPLNRFWRVLAEAVGEDVPQSVEDKKCFLKKHKIALWDVVTECEIEGSLDSNIRDYKEADLNEVFKSARIKMVILNGGKARSIYEKRYGEYAGITVCLPSTSPANARFDKTLWIDAISSACAKE